MSFFDNARQSKFVKPEEKQENISRLAGFYLDRLSVAETASVHARSITLLTRSAASPIARAMFASMRDCQRLDVSIQVIVNQLEPADLLSDWMELSVSPVNTSATVELRWARNPALSDAHEQMVLGTTFSWHGDCMRRDPETRDAFETFECFNAAVARRATLSFAALWSKCKPVTITQTTRTAPLAGQVPHDVLNSLNGRLLPLIPGATASTRH